MFLGKEGKRHALASSNGLNGNDGTIPTPPQPAKDHSHVLGNIYFNHFDKIKGNKTGKPFSKQCYNWNYIGTIRDFLIPVRLYDYSLDCLMGYKKIIGIGNL